MVLLVLVGGVNKLPKVENFGFEVCPLGPLMAAPHGTSNGITVVPQMAAQGPRIATIPLFMFSHCLNQR